MTAVRTVRVIALLLSLTVCVLGQTQQSAVRTGAAEAGTITGRVVNENGQPLAGAGGGGLGGGGGGGGGRLNRVRPGEESSTRPDSRSRARRCRFVRWAVVVEVRSRPRIVRANLHR